MIPDKISEERKIVWKKIEKKKLCEKIPPTTKKKCKTFDNGIFNNKKFILKISFVLFVYIFIIKKLFLKKLKKIDFSYGKRCWQYLLLYQKSGAWVVCRRRYCNFIVGSFHGKMAISPPTHNPRTWKNFQHTKCFIKFLKFSIQKSSHLIFFSCSYFQHVIFVIKFRERDCIFSIRLFIRISGTNSSNPEHILAFSVFWTEFEKKSYSAFPKVVAFFLKKKRHVSDNYGAGKNFKLCQFLE